MRFVTPHPDSSNQTSNTQSSLSCPLATPEHAPTGHPSRRKHKARWSLRPRKSRGETGKVFPPVNVRENETSRLQSLAQVFSEEPFETSNSEITHL
jgi:hypothetical protein